MKDEIKEISGNIRKIIKSNREDNFNRIIYDCDSLEKLLDYITNLQEETKRQSKAQVILDNQIAEMLKYKERNKKAIEYINKHCVNEKVSKEVGFKCYTMADTNELEHIMKLLGSGK